MKDNRISAAIRKAGMLYFEYNPKKHIATRPDFVMEDGMPDTLENYPECVIERTVKSPVHANVFRNAFKNMDAGAEHEYFEVEICMNSHLYWFAYNLVRVSGQNRVICVALDCTEKHMYDAMERLLLREQYEAISLIDSEKKTCMIRLMKPNESFQGKEWVGYEEESRDSARRYVTPSEQDLFMEKAAIPVILEHLNAERKYSFIVNGFDQQGNEQLHQYSYHYLDERKRMILATLEDVTKITEHDVLTGVFNRTGFNRHVTEFLENCEDRMQYAILFFNVKGFKAINELLGLEGGDYVLKESVDILRTCFLKPVAISRLEADHFAVLVNKSNLDYEKLSKLCSRRFEINGKSIHYYGRCGIYLINDTVHTVSGMCDRARLANEYVEDDYVKPYAVYDQNMRVQFMKKKELLYELEHGIHNEEFEVYYQPVYDVISEKIVSAEALVRWIHPEYGMISPGEFISVFEETGHISQLDYLVEENAKKLILERIAAKKKIVPIAINLSRMDFYDAEFMNKIIADINEISQLDEFCRLEITESAYSTLADYAAKYIKAFKDAGVKILLDDFGSGYSSFSTLRDFDFDILKLDLGFIQMIGENEKVEGIIESIIDMAHILKLEVIAEGVETEVQKKFLSEHHCDYIQGYYYAKPLPRAEFIKLLDRMK